MIPEQITQIVKDKSLPFPTKGIKLIETHISWVLLTDQYAYKIKKPLKLSFLNFSTMARRKHFCELEVQLNKRLAPEMYLGILPVYKREGDCFIGESNGTLVDYAVWMRRFDEGLQLDVLLQKGGVVENDIISLAEMIASFHQQANKFTDAEDWKELYSEFEDLCSVLPRLEKIIGHSEAGQIKKITNAVKDMLCNLGPRIESRKKSGFVLDGHGDLHCRNIFMTNPPVVFDCIEFSDELRTLDVLSEIGFLCMDLERLGRPDLSDVFNREYQRRFSCLMNEEDQKLLLFYKMYRANVRMKVEALALPDAPNGNGKARTIADSVRSYYRLFESYAAELGLA